MVIKYDHNIKWCKLLPSVFQIVFYTRKVCLLSKSNTLMNMETYWVTPLISSQMFFFQTENLSHLAIIYGVKFAGIS